MVKKILVRGKNHLATPANPQLRKKALESIEISLPILKKINDEDLAYLQETYKENAFRYKTIYTKMYKHISNDPKKKGKPIELIIEKNNAYEALKPNSNTFDKVTEAFELEKLPSEPYSRSAGALQRAVVTPKASEKYQLTTTSVSVEELKQLYDSDTMYLQGFYGLDAKNYTTTHVSMYETITDLVSSKSRTEGNLNGTYCNPNKTLDLVIPNYHEARSPELAEKVFNATGPRIIHLTDKFSKPVPFETDSSDYLSAVANGCGGNGSPEQAQVAVTMDYIAGLQELRVMFVAGLGDFWYKHVINSLVHADFNKLFYLVWYKTTLRNLYKLRVQGSFGNHCEGYDKVENWKQFFAPVLPNAVNKAIKNPFGREAGKHIIMQANLDRFDGLTSPINRAKLFTRSIDSAKPEHVTMDFKEASPLDIPYYFTSRILLETFQLLYINTNDLPRYFIQYLLHETGIKLMTAQEEKENQFIFMARAYKYGEAENLIQVAIQHIPLYELKGREDGEFYTPVDEMIRLDLIMQLPYRFLSPEFLAKAKIILQTTIQHLRYIHGIPEPTVNRFSQNISLARLFKLCGWYFTLIACAHDHMLAYTNIPGMPQASFNETWEGKNRYVVNPNRPDDISNYKICQVTSGGGGGSLQDRVVFNQIRDSYFIKSHGVAVLTFNKKTRTIDINLMTTLTSSYENKKEVRRPGLHMRFVAGKSAPIQDIADEPDIVDGRPIKRPKFYIKPLPHLFQKKAFDENALKHRLLSFIDYATDVLNIYENDEPALTKIEIGEKGFFKSIAIDRKIKKAIEERKKLFLMTAIEREKEAVIMRNRILQCSAKFFNPSEFNYLLRQFSPKHLTAADFEYRMDFIKDFISKSECLTEDKFENFFKFETLRTLVTITGKEYQLFLDEKMKSTNGNFYSITVNTTHTLEEGLLINKIINYVSKYKIESYETTLLTIANMIAPLKSIDGKHSFYESLNYKLSCSKIFKGKNLNELVRDAKRDIEHKTNKPIAPVRPK